MRLRTITYFLLWLFTVHLDLFNRNVFAQQEQEMDKFNRSELSYTASKLKDPFENYLPQERTGAGRSSKKETEKDTSKPLPTFSIQGIIWGGPFPQAIVDGKILKIGDTIEEANVVGIDKEGVSLLYYGREYKISAPGHPSNKTVSSNETIKGGQK